MQEHTCWPLMFEPMHNPIHPPGRQMSSTLAHLVCNLIDVAGCMRKVENAQRIMTMALHKALNPLGPILDGTHFFGSLNTPSTHFRTGLISKGCGVGHACKVREIGRDHLLFVFASAAF